MVPLTSQVLEQMEITDQSLFLQDVTSQKVAQNNQSLPIEIEVRGHCFEFSILTKNLAPDGWCYSHQNCLFKANNVKKCKI